MAEAAAAERGRQDPAGDHRGRSRARANQKGSVLGRGKGRSESQLLEMSAELQKKADRTQDAVATFRQIAELNPQARPKSKSSVIATLSEGRDFKGARRPPMSALKKYPNDRMVCHGTCVAAVLNWPSMTPPSPN